MVRKTTIRRMKMGCRFCNQSENVDGGLDRNGNFICIDCIALDSEANAELVQMQPLQTGHWSTMQYPPECYDVSRFKHKQKD